MPRQEQLGSDLALFEQQGLMQALGQLYAKSFATYTSNVLALLAERGLLRGTPAPSSAAAEAAVEALPDWVREEYEAEHQAAPVEVPPELPRRAVRNRIILALRERGWSQAELARRAGKSPTAVSRVLKDPGACRVKTLADLAAALDLQPAELLSPANGASD